MRHAESQGRAEDRAILKGDQIHPSAGRILTFGESLTVEDMMTGGDALERIPVSRPFYAIHMASAGYWQRQDDEA